MIESQRLKRLLELTRRVERARKGELMVAKAELAQAEAALQAAEAAAAQRTEELVHGGEATLTELELRAGLVDHARGLARACDVARDEHEKTAHAREEDRLVATRDVRKMELLWERDREIHKRLTNVQEQRFIDDTRRPKRRTP
ncbi:MAG: hypothetical protein RL385_5251 [Pseudomonadota bacterium]|jgi:hypothetical protein